MPVIVIVVRLTCAVPAALDEHPEDIMLLVGISIAKVMSSPDMVPRKDPGIRPCMPEPEKLIEPVTVAPLCVSGQVIVPMPVWPIMLPAPIEMLESSALPVHVPDIEPVGPEGIIGELLPHAATNHVNRTTANAFVILPPSFAETCRAMSDPVLVSFRGRVTPLHQWSIGHASSNPSKMPA